MTAETRQLAKAVAVLDRESEMDMWEGGVIVPINVWCDFIAVVEQITGELELKNTSACWNTEVAEYERGARGEVPQVRAVLPAKDA